MISQEDRKFGKFLVERGVATPAQLLEVLRLNKHNNLGLPQVFIEKGIASAGEVFSCLADYLEVPFIELQNYVIDPTVLEIVPKELAEKYTVFPVFRIEGSLTVAMVNPGDVQVIDALHRETGYTIEPAVSTEQDIVNAISSHYESSGEIDSSFNEVIQNIESQQPKLVDSESSSERLKKLSAETPVVKLVDLIIAQAIMDGASDIHIEPEENSLQVRCRIDGILHENLTPPKHLQAAIISRIKILAELDIAESRTPQDGRFQVSLAGRDVDLRVSTLPTVYGENVVMRILDKGNQMLSLNDLGFDGNDFERFQAMLNSSYGVLLVSGPTGSGKTTTLYSALSTINTPEKKIVTVEDPVEYRLKRIRQCQVNVKAGLTFAAGLRSILRQDPDIIMVGEIRDGETAKIAVESALTGHLVLSTIHTNDAPGGLTRLTEMGIEPFLTASATIGIVAQRLVRKLCAECKKSFAPSSSLRDNLQLKKSETFFHGTGCQACKDTGYKGRAGIYEIMTINDEIRNLILKNASSALIKEAAFANGMHSLRQDALRRARKGITSLEEVARVTNAD